MDPISKGWWFQIDSIFFETPCISSFTTCVIIIPPISICVAHVAKFIFHAVEWREISIFRLLPACFLLQLQLSLVYFVQGLLQAC